jgi:hypothetical protein
MLLKLFPIVVCLVLVLRLNGTNLCCAQQPDSASAQTSTRADKRFETPQATADYWVRAVKKHNWREEYACYAGAQQAKFTLQVMISTRELNDSHDLAIELERILQKFSFPSNMLDDFPSLRVDLSNLSDPCEIQSGIDDRNEKRQLQLIRWQREVQPLNIDWGRMIGELQPLFTESYKRHLHDLHPSNTGIAHHLGFHLFDRASIVIVDGNLAHGSIVAIVRDPNVLVDSDVGGPEPKGLTTSSTFWDRCFQFTLIRPRRVKRPPEEIRLVRQADGWKIDSVPFR